MHPKIIWVSPGHLFQSSSCTVHISRMETTRNHMACGQSCTVDASSLECYSTQATLVQEQPCVNNHCPDVESTVNEVLVFSARLFSKSLFCTILYYLPIRILVGRHNRRRRPTSLCPLNFANKPFLSRIRRYRTMPLPRLLF